MGIRSFVKNKVLPKINKAQNIASDVITKTLNPQQTVKQDYKGNSVINTPQGWGTSTQTIPKGGGKATTQNIMSGTVDLTAANPGKIVNLKNVVSGSSNPMAKARQEYFKMFNKVPDEGATLASMQDDITKLAGKADEGVSALNPFNKEAATLTSGKGTQTETMLRAAETFGAEAKNPATEAAMFRAAQNARALEAGYGLPAGSINAKSLYEANMINKVSDLTSSASIAEKKAASGVIDQSGSWKFQFDEGNALTNSKGYRLVKDMLMQSKNKIAVGLAITFATGSVGWMMYSGLQTPNDKADVAYYAGTGVKLAAEQGDIEAMKEFSNLLTEAEAISNIDPLGYPKAASLKLKSAKMYTDYEIRVAESIKREQERATDGSIVDETGKSWSQVYLETMEKNREAARIAQEQENILWDLRNETKREEDLKLIEKEVKMWEDYKNRILDQEMEMQLQNQLFWSDYQKKKLESMSKESESGSSKLNFGGLV